LTIAVSSASSAVANWATPASRIGFASSGTEARPLTRSACLVTTSRRARTKPANCSRAGSRTAGGLSGKAAVNSAIKAASIASVLARRPLAPAKWRTRPGSKIRTARPASIRASRASRSQPPEASSPATRTLRSAFEAQYSPRRLAVYASRPSSPMIPQHSLLGGRYPLPGPDFHRLDRASFAWRTQTVSHDRLTETPGTKQEVQPRRCPQSPPHR
jgi:hypothetical protein